MKLNNDQAIDRFCEAVRKSIKEIYATLEPEKMSGLVSVSLNINVYAENFDKVADQLGLMKYEKYTLEKGQSGGVNDRTHMEVCRTASGRVLGGYYGAPAHMSVNLTQYSTDINDRRNSIEGKKDILDEFKDKLREYGK